MSNSGLQRVLANGCTTRVCTTLAFASKPGKGGNNAELNPKLKLPEALGKIYPNPNDGEFVINIYSKLEKEEAKATILDLQGRQVAQMDLSKGENKIKEKLSAGSYNILVVVKEKTYMERVIVK
jgi:hypothetical protein